jgi:hypothetical protein
MVASLSSRVACCCLATTGGRHTKELEKEAYKLLKIQSARPDWFFHFVEDFAPLNNNVHIPSRNCRLHFQISQTFEIHHRAIQQAPDVWHESCGVAGSLERLPHSGEGQRTGQTNHVA